MEKKASSLYIHFPFCNSICPYCDFVKFIKNEKFISNYLEQLNNDLDQLIEAKSKFKTIYIGGGTPSILGYENLSDLLFKVNKLAAPNCEFTIEANPESLDKEKLIIMEENGVNRISIGLQSFNKEVLKFINRDYNVDYFELINLVKHYIPNINIDLIFGFPIQTEEDLKNDLENFIKLDVDHISIYALTIYQNTTFRVRNIQAQDETASAESYEYIVSFLKAHGYERYEVSNFARNKKYSKHNLTYWHNEQYVGLGVGASGYEGDIRYTNSGNLTLYLNGHRKREEEILSKQDEMEYHLICNLRLEKGFYIQDFNERFETDIFEEFPVLQNLINRKLLFLSRGRLYAGKNLIILDFILDKFISGSKENLQKLEEEKNSKKKSKSSQSVTPPIEEIKYDFEKEENEEEEEFIGEGDGEL